MNPDKNQTSLSRPFLHDSPDSSAGESESLVHTQETSVHNDDSPSYRQYLLSGIHKKAAVVDKLFADVDSRDGTNRSRAWRGCRTSAWFVQHENTGEIRVASKRCHLRWCPLCSRVDRFATTQSVKEKLLSVKSPRFITLTLKHSSNDLSDQIDHLYDSWRRIRRQKQWKEHVDGGVWFFQIKWIESSQEWHPHIHILCTGKYFPQDILSRLWNKASSGSWIVDVRAVKDVDKAAEYVARYATEPVNLCDLPGELPIKVYDSLYSRRIKGSFGSWNDVSLVAAPPEDSAVWRYVGSYYEIMVLRRKWALCAEIVESWLAGVPCSKMYIIPPIPPPDPEPLPDVIESYRQSLLFRF